MSKKINFDLNDAGFQQDFFNLEKNELIAFIKTLKKIRNLTWDQLYKDQGLKWEAITPKNAREGDKVYTFRFSQKYRAVAFRSENTLFLMSLHTDHDSAYH